jgi:hypothetical protein
MKRQMMILLLATAVAIPVLAGPKKLVRLEGWIVDSYCGAKNANAESAEDTLACHKKGAKLILISSDLTSYAIKNQERALEHVGKQIKVFGLVDEDRNLEITNYLGTDPQPIPDSEKKPKPPKKPSTPTGPEKKDD